MKYIDLHVHSTVSDGTFTPTELVAEAKRCNLSAFALTDHDTVRGFEEAKKASEGSGIEVIPGVEISAAYKKKDIHILGLLIDPNYEPLKRSLDAALLERDQRNAKMAQNLAAGGLDIDIERLTAAFSPGTVLTRAHFAKFLLETKQIKSMNEAFEHYLNADGPYYVPREYISPENAIKLIKQAGGIPVLAHPLVYHLPEEELDTLIARLKDAGLEGLEVFYSSNTGFDEGIVRRYANKYHLIMTGGSDFHGANKPHISMGSGKGNLKIPYSVLENLKAALK
ncbi:pHP domain protein [Clostridium sp. CAG:411]|jgi:predicted metal-dependent phosphoesterase TrpH|nr:PHP domain-containing protein [Lachnospiraceae bacterium]CDE46661.1 pHP domain protein [Clostridium sp. CAG:411]